jgi:hypothetical protein
MEDGESAARGGATKGNATTDGTDDTDESCGRITETRAYVLFARSPESFRCAIRGLTQKGGELALRATIT